MNPGASMAASPTLVGRTEELRRLNVLLDIVASGQAQVAVLVGEPGIGKTRLARELLTLAGASGHRVLEGRAARLEAALSLVPPDRAPRSGRA